MSYRKLIDGSKVKEENESVKMTIDSRCPRKWVFVDLETGDMWMHKTRIKNGSKLNYTFYGVDLKTKNCLEKVLKL